MDQLRSMPSSREAERAVLSAILQLPDEIMDLAKASLTEEAFYVPAHRTMYRALCVMHARNDAIDPLTFHHYCESAKILEEIGGDAAIAETYSFITSAAHFEFYRDIVLSKAALRDTITTCMEAVATIYEEPDIEPHGFLARLESKIGGLRDHHDGGVALQTVRAAILERQDHWNTLHEMHAKGIPTTEVATGWKWLDQMTGGLQPGYWVWCARPSAGKTTALVQLVDRASQVGPVAVFSLEMTSGQLIDRWAASYGVEGERFRDGAFSQLDFRSIHRMAQDVHGRPVYMDDRPTLTAGEICAICRMLWRKHGKLSGVFVDYLQITAPADKEERRDKRMKIENASAAFKTLSKQIGCPVVVAAQLGRPKRGERAEPSYSDIEWCGTVEQNADFIILKWRLGSAGETKLPCGDLAGLPDGCDPIAWKLAKQRNGRIGGRVMALDGKHFRFEQFSASHQPKTDDEW